MTESRKSPKKSVSAIPVQPEQGQPEQGRYQPSEAAGPDDGKVIRRYTYRLYPTRTQAEALQAQRRLHCDLYNACLQQRIEAWSRQRKPLGFFDQTREIKELRQVCPAYSDAGASALAGTVRRLDKAFQHFFRRARSGAGASSGFPRFRSFDHYPGFSLGPHRDGWRFDPGEDARRTNGRLYVKGIPGMISARGRMPGTGAALSEMDEEIEIKAADIVWRDDRWNLSIVVRMPVRRRAGQFETDVRLSLTKEFARVEIRADGGHAAGPSLFWMNGEGRIVTGFQEPGSQLDAGTPESGSDRGYAGEGAARPVDAGTPESGSDRGVRQGRRVTAPDAGTPESGSDRGSVRSALHSEPAGAGVPETCSDRELVNHKILSEHGAGERDAGEQHDPAASPGVNITPQEKIAALQRQLDRYQRGSCRQRRLRKRIAGIHRRLRRRRHEELHLWSSLIVTGASRLVLTAPRSIKEATRSGKGTRRDPGAAVQDKAELNRHLLDQAPAESIRMLEYKCAEAGIPVERIDCDDILIGNRMVEEARFARAARRGSRSSTATDVVVTDAVLAGGPA